MHDRAPICKIYDLKFENSQNKGHPTVEFFGTVVKKHIKWNTHLAFIKWKYIVNIFFIKQLRDQKHKRLLQDNHKVAAHEKNF